MRLIYVYLMLSCLLLLNSILDSLGFWDVLLGIPLIYGLYKGLRNGIVVEIASILALIAGIYGVMHFSYIASDFLQERFSWDSRTIKLAAFALTFLAILFAVHLLGRFLTRIINLTGLGILNVLTGGVFGVLKVALILGALFVFYERASQTTGLMESDQLKHSFLYAPLKELGAIAFDHILEPENFTSE